MPGYMNYSFVLATLLCVQTISAVEDSLVQFQPGISIQEVIGEQVFQQMNQVDQAFLQQRMLRRQRKADWLKFDQKCQTFFLKNVFPPLLLFVMFHEEPQKVIPLVVPYLLYMV
jgi:hypothetical protein